MLGERLGKFILNIQKQNSFNEFKSKMINRLHKLKSALSSASSAHEIIGR